MIPRPTIPEGGSSFYIKTLKGLTIRPETYGDYYTLKPQKTPSGKVKMSKSINRRLVLNTLNIGDYIRAHRTKYRILKGREWR